MLVDAKYGEVTLENAPESATDANVEEPVFVLRAQDEMAVPILSRYYNLLRSTHEEGAEVVASQEVLDGVQQRIVEFSAWRADNPERMKVPD